MGEKYRLLSKIGEGGMGAVWVAQNEILDIEVAIKFIRAERAGVDSPHLADRLLREARAAAQLGHPAIVRVLDYGTTTVGDPYLVMELLDGESLDETLDRRERVSAVRAVQSLLPIAHALATAHEKGIVHRDLKPENVIIAQNEHGLQPKLIDFGIVKVSQKPTRLTREGDLVGTPDYFAPEQARGEDSDHRADIWAFCVLIYEMVTGLMPFAANNYHALVRAIIEDEPKPITDHAAGDADLWSILAQGMSKDPEQRWPSMRALGAALASWLMDRGVVEDVCGASLESVWFGDSSVSSRDAFESVPPPSHQRAPRSTPVLTPPEPRVGLLSEPSIDDILPGGEPSTADTESVDLLLAPERRSRRTLAAVVTIALLALAGGLAWYLTSGGQPSDPAASAAEPHAGIDTSTAADTTATSEPTAASADSAAPAASASATPSATAAAEPSAEVSPKAKTTYDPAKAPAPRVPPRTSPPGLKAPTFD
ncbi:MAG: serine/threonine protein kinase [Deltaproteobacteria bacterium]|nr:serine/threonine protein kinase [Deltaproteobacteria bacterium]MBW2532198.1 serine/threonine protein kinase [Deltaproteobacteria bacterium]